MHSKYPYIVALSILTLAGCSSSIPPEERQAAREEINATSDTLINQLSERYPDLPERLAYADGYAAVSMSNVKIPVLGGGTGVGAIYDQRDGSVTYINVNRYEVGAGLSLGTTQALAIFNDASTLKEYRSGSWEPSVGAEWFLGEDGQFSSMSLAGRDEDVPIYLVSSSGGGAVGSAKVVSVSVNYDLTETGLGENRVPNKEPITASDAPPKKWDRALPFYAQNVIDKGFSLPKPFGISVIYADTFQQMQLNDLEVGFRGSNKVPIDFVSFDNNTSHTQTPQLKLDAWVFPFMNVFATVGKISGEADIQFTIDGNDFINQAGIDCSKLANKPVCNRVEDKALTVPVVADLSGTNYTVGTILASGWKDYFFTVPISASYADMRRSDAEGFVLNISPRVGKQIPLKGTQSIAIYAGATYLDSRLTISGSQPIPGISESIDYKVEQENIDKWLGLVGANYNFNRDWSISMEYGQNGSKKRQFVSSLTRRF
ncbi:hypothetical protein [Vibrio mediterranei]|uniref:hypothetical protein n=1 Tax=Vibrio mediterranei TaxID=689 RepID=UPI004068692B